MKLFLGFIFALVTLSAIARPGPQWANEPEYIRQWFASVMQPNGYTSCCGAGDAFEATIDGETEAGDFLVTVVNGKGQIEDGTGVLVPREKLQTKYGNPLDKIILFLSSDGRPLCLIPKAGV
jgi:hypothetical protein